MYQEWMEDVIDPNGIGHIFSMSTWQSFLAFLYVVIISILIYKILRKKSFSFALYSSFAIGLVGLGIFGIIFSNTQPDPIIYDLNDLYYELEEIFQELVNSGVVPPEFASYFPLITWVDESRDWLQLYTSIFFSLIFLIIPMYIFVAIVLLIIKPKKKRIGSKTFLSLGFWIILLPIIGISVALMLIPLIHLMDPTKYAELIGPALEDTGEAYTLLDAINSWIPSSLSIFASAAAIISVAIFACLIGIAILGIKGKHPQNYDSTVKFFDIFKLILDKYMHFIIYLLPFAIATRLPIIALSYSSGEALTLIAIWFALFLVGFLIIFLLINGLILIMIRKNEKSMKEKLNILGQHHLYSLSSGNTIIALPSTQKTSLDLGVRYEITEIGSTLGTMNGYVMCGGFAPMLMVLMTAYLETVNSGEQLTAAFLILAVITLLILSISTFGVVEADFIITTSTLTALNLNPQTLFTWVFTISPIKESFSAVNDTSGNILAMIASDKVYKDSNEDFDFIKAVPFNK